MHVEFSQLTITDLFAKSYQYRVPLYQRPYRWELSNVEYLWSDISDVGAHGHFLGPMVLCADKQDPRGVDVIDGQQRLTTLQILLALIRDRYAALGDLELEDGEKASDNVHELIRRRGQAPFWRLRLGDANRTFFEDFILRKPQAIDHNRRPLEDYSTLSKVDRSRNKALYDATRLLRQKLDIRLAASSQPLKSLERLQEGLVERVSVGVLTVQDLDDAYVLFETLNDRGLRLSAADLLKSHLLSQYAKLKKADASSLESAADRWDDLLESLGGGDISTFLRHFLLVEHKKVRKAEIFPFFKQKIATAGPEITLKDLCKLGGYYAEFVAPPEDGAIGDVLSDLNQTSVDTHRVALLAARAHLPADSFVRFARAAEALSFRWAITGGNAQQLETIYHDAAKRLSDSLGTLVDAVQDDLLKLLPSDSEFEAAFAAEALGYQYMATYALRKIESALSPHGEVKLKGPKSVHLEHIMPRTVTPFWHSRVADPTLYEATVQRWGNLTLLAGPKNEEISNGPWQTKQAAYLGSKVDLTKDLAGLGDWSVDEIERSRPGSAGKALTAQAPQPG